MITLAALVLLAQVPAKPPAKPAAKASSASFDAVAKQADEAREQNRLEDAIKAYQQALKLKPSWHDGWWYLATLLYDQDRYPEARDAFRKLLASAPKNGAALALLGLCEFQTKEYGTALNHLNQARFLGYSGNKQMIQVVSYHTAILLTRFERYETALDLLMDLVKQGMGGPKIVEAAGIAALRKPILPSDVAESDREIIALVGRAVCTVGERKAAEAQKQFETLLAAYPNTPNVHYLYGSFLLVNDPEEGLRQLQRELEISEDHLPTLVAITFEYLKRGEAEKGLPYAERAVKTAPNSFAACAALGRVLIDAGKLTEGIQQLEHAVQLAPDSPQVRISLASAYAKAGRPADAAKQRAEFLKLKNLNGPASKGEQP